MKTSNGHIKEMKPGDVYCGRGKGFYRNPMNCSVGNEGWLGNPIAIGEECIICKKKHLNGGSTLPCYEIYLLNRLHNDALFRTLFYGLKGKKLICFCKPKPCHTDIMIKYLDEMPQIKNNLV